MNDVFDILCDWLLKDIFQLCLVYTNQVIIILIEKYKIVGWYLFFDKQNVPTVLFKNLKNKWIFFKILHWILVILYYIMTFS